MITQLGNIAKAVAGTALKAIGGVNIEVSIDLGEDKKERKTISKIEEKNDIMEDIYIDCDYVEKDTAKENNKVKLCRFVIH